MMSLALMNIKREDAGKLGLIGALGASALMGVIGLIPWPHGTPPTPISQAPTAWPPKIEQAVVSIQPKGQPSRRCPKLQTKNTTRHQCDSPSWAYVGAKPDMRINGQTHRCIWAHPLEDTQTIIRYAPTLRPSQPAATLRFALDDRAVGAQGAPIHIEVRLGQQHITHQHPNQRGWTEIDLGPLIKAQPEEALPALELTLSAPQVGRRHLCFELN